MGQFFFGGLRPCLGREEWGRRHHCFTEFHWNRQTSLDLYTPTTTPAIYSPFEKTSDRRLGNFPHSAYYPPFRSNFPHIPFRIVPSAFRVPQFRILPTAPFVRPGLQSIHNMYYAVLTFVSHG